jgi:general secretion pathway protein B
MSYILDALKKADRDRNLVKVPTLTTVHIPVSVTRRRVAVWTLAGVLLIGGSLFWFLRPSPTEVPRAAVDHRQNITATLPTNTSDLTRAAAPTQATDAPPAALAGPGLPGPSVGTRQEARRQFDRESAMVFRPRWPTPSQSSKPVPQPIEVERVEPRPAEARQAPPSPTPEPQPSAEASQVRTDAVVPPSVSSPNNLPTLRDAMTKMVLDVFVYADAEADRMATINGRRYTKGQLVDGRYLVEDITPEGVLLSFQGERAILRP